MATAEQQQQLPPLTNALAGWSHLTRTAAHTLPDRYFRTGNIRKAFRALRTGRR